MELVSNRARGPTRRVTRNGREYLVAPLTLIVPGVLNGSRGALMYPPDEIAKNVRAWDGVPLTRGHPYDRNGAAVPARSPGVLARQGLGVVREPQTAPDGRLRAEGWFDVARTRRVDPSLLRSLERGDRIELSTGLYTSNEPAPPGSRCPNTGRGYDWIARNHRPDHLAVLVDQRGACSLDDGCGVNTNGAAHVPRDLDPDPLPEAPTSNDFITDLTEEQDDGYAEDTRELARALAEQDEEILRHENRRRLGLFDDPPPEGDPLDLPTDNEKYGAGFHRGSRVQFPAPSGRTWTGTVVWIDHDSRIADVLVDGRTVPFNGVQVARLKPVPGTLSGEERDDLTLADPIAERDRENRRRLATNEAGDDPLDVMDMANLGYRPV